LRQEFGSIAAGFASAPRSLRARNTLIIRRGDQRVGKTNCVRRIARFAKLAS
jgi:hypothetical protein